MYFEIVHYMLEASISWFEKEEIYSNLKTINMCGCEKENVHGRCCYQKEQ